MALQIFFRYSVDGEPQTDGDVCSMLTEELKCYGKVLTEERGKKPIDKTTDKDIYRMNMESLRKSDVMVAEVTRASMGIGFKLGVSSERKIPTLCLYRPSDAEKPLSAMVGGAENGDLFQVRQYKDMDEAKQIIRKFMEGRKSQSASQMNLYND